MELILSMDSLFSRESRTSSQGHTYPPPVLYAQPKEGIDRPINGTHTYQHSDHTMEFP